MSVLDCYNYIYENNFRVHNDSKRRFKIYYNTIKSSVRQHQEFDTRNLIDKTKRLIKVNDSDIMCNITFKWIDREFIPYDINLQPYVKEVHIRVLLSQAYIIFSLMNTPRTITKYNVHVL